MITNIKFFLILHLLLIGNILHAQCNANAIVISSGIGLYSIKNQSLSNGNPVAAEIAFCSSTSGSLIWTLLDEFSPNETRIIQDSLPENITLYSVSLRDSNYMLCDSVVFDINGVAIWSFPDCILDVTVVETNAGQVLITNNSTSNGAPLEVVVSFNETTHTNYIPGNQSIVYPIHTNGTHSYDVLSYELVTCPHYNGSITITTSGPVICNAYFTSSVVTSVAPNLFYFAAPIYSGSPGYSFDWDYGDGNIGLNDAHANHTYIEPGDYNVCLLVSNPSAGCSDFFCREITVGTQNPTSCDANFYLFQDSLDATAIYAWNLSTGTNLNYFWSFGDGATSSDQFPTHVYDEVGIYDLCLTVYNSDCSDSICQPIEILVKAQGVTLYVISQDSELSTPDLELDLNLNVFPNPATNHTLLTWTSSTVNEYEIQVIDLNGKVLNATNINSISGKNDYSIDLSTYEKGMYFIHIQNESTGKKEMRRIVKN